MNAISLTEAADEFDINVGTLSRYVRRGLIRVVQEPDGVGRGHKKFVARSDVEALVKARLPGRLGRNQGRELVKRILG